MDIERLKKINRMTKDLQKAGFASNSREAHSQAESFFKESAPPEAQEKKKQDAPAPEDKDVEYLIEQKVKLLVSMHTKNVANDIQAIREQIHAVLGQVASLRQEVASLKVKRELPAPEKKIAQAPPVNKKETKNEPNPRQGNFTSEDVSIEKMFYFGRK